MTRERSNSFLREIVQLYVVYFITVFSVYYLPSIVTLILLVVILVIFYQSKKGYFWIAFVFIAESQPGALFEITDTEHTLSLLQNTPLGYLFFWLVFTPVAFIKVFKTNAPSRFFLQGQVIALIIYAAILLLAFGFKKLNFFGGLIPWLLLFILPRLFKDMKDYEGFFNLVFSFVFFVLASQLFFLLTGTPISALVGANLGDSHLIGVGIEVAGVALRPDAGIYIPFIAIIGSAVFLIYKNNQLSRKYLHVVMITSLFSIFITATRGWLIAGIIVFLAYFFITAKNPFSIVPKFILPAVLLLLLFNFVPQLKKQSDLVIERMLTLVSLAEGDETAGGTLSRLDERPERVMKGFYMSPILGSGWGGEGNKYADPHVGNQNLLLNSGIIGFSLYVFFWLSYIAKMLFREKNLTKKNPYKGVPLILVAAFLALIFIHSTSSQWFGYGFNYIRGFVLFFILSLASFVYWESLNQEKERK